MVEACRDPSERTIVSPDAVVRAAMHEAAKTRRKPRAVDGFRDLACDAEHQRSLSARIEV
jgi:hypothetical protein